MEEEKLAVTSAVSCEFILGVPMKKGLTPLQQLLFAVIKSYILHDTKQFESKQKLVS